MKPRDLAIVVQADEHDPDVGTLVEICPPESSARRKCRHEHGRGHDDAPTITCEDNDLQDEQLNAGVVRCARV